MYINYDSDYTSGDYVLSGEITSGSSYTYTDASDNVWSDGININQNDPYKFPYTDGFTNFAFLMVKVYGIVTDYPELKCLLSSTIQDSEFEDGIDFMERAEKYFNSHGIHMNAFREDFVILSMESDSLSLTKEEKKKFRNIYPVMNPTRYFITVNFKNSSYA